MAFRASRIKDGKIQLTEKQFFSQIRDAAHGTGWLFYHTHDSRHSAAGFPDCVMVNAKRRRIIFAELKTSTGKVTPEQQEWINEINATRITSVHAYVLRPVDFDWFMNELLR